MCKKYIRWILILNGIISMLFFTETINFYNQKKTVTNDMNRNMEWYKEKETNDEEFFMEHVSVEQGEYIIPETVSKKRTINEETFFQTKKYQLCDAEYNLLLKLVEAEAGGEDATGKKLVANVVFNRVNSDKFPNSVAAVILQRDESGAQFSPVSDGRIDCVKVSEDTKLAVEQVMWGEDTSKGALYFLARKHSDADNIKWFDENLTFVLSHGGHEFFK